MFVFCYFFAQPPCPTHTLTHFYFCKSILTSIYCSHHLSYVKGKGEKKGAFARSDDPDGISDADEWLMGVGSRATWTLLWLECNEHHERPLLPPVEGYLSSSYGRGLQAEGDVRSCRLMSHRTQMLPTWGLCHGPHWRLTSVEPIENETLPKKFLLPMLVPAFIGESRKKCLETHVHVCVFFIVRLIFQSRSQVYQWDDVNSDTSRELHV